MEQQYMENDEASIHDIENYLGYFYEDNMDHKVIASRKILQLCMDLNNMEILIEHEQLMGVICRILKEEFKKSTELTIYLLSILFVFSNYSQFHQYLTMNQVGGTTLDIVEYHIDRFNLRYAEFMELGKKHQDYQQELRKLNLMIAKQDKIFYMALSILLNLAEDFSIEKKMRKKNIISFLCKLLERNDFHLLIVVLLFIRKLSIISENKEQMLNEKVVPRLERFFSCNNNILLQLTLGVLKNISFCSKMREQIDQAGYIPKVVQLLNQPNFRFISITVLYLLSLDDKLRVTFSYTDCIKMVIKLMVHFPERHIGKELIALAVNLAASERNAELVSAEEVKVITDRAFKSQDINLFKFVKNLCIYTKAQEVQGTLQRFMKHFVKMALMEKTEDDLKIECIGIFSHLQLGEKWMEYLENPKFMDFIVFNLSPNVDDDIILETIMMVSHICENEKCCEYMASQKMLVYMCQLLIEKGDDDEFITQILYAIYQFLYHKLGIEYVLESEEVMVTLINNIRDRNLEVRKINDHLLDILREQDMGLTERVREEKFYEFNNEWAESMQEYEGNYIGEEQLINQAYYQDYLEEEDQLNPQMWDPDYQYQ